MAATNCIHAYIQHNVLKFKLSRRMEKKGYLSDFHGGIVVGSKQAGLSISETDVLGFFPHNYL